MGVPTTEEELHPLLVADLADPEACEELRAVAAEGSLAIVPLVAAPVDRRLHLLEVYVAGVDRAERFFAIPVGGPTEGGFPLRLEPYRPDRAPADFPSEAPTAVTHAPKTPTEPKLVRGTAGTKPTLTDRHSRDLEPVARVTGPSPSDAYVGLALAGGKYRLDACVGRGGMGAVYRATHRELRKDVAIKILHNSHRTEPQFAKRFHAEALTMSKIDHPNITRVLDFGEEEEDEHLLYLVMEFLDGRDLQSVIDNEGPLQLDRIARLMMQVGAALGHVHRAGVIHRDVKPTNILLVAGLDEDDTPTENVKVCDFGIALARGSGGRVAGTPEYMSPEQCRGLELDARSDIYACGVVMYELATGRLPFSSKDATETMRMHAGSMPVSPSHYVPDLDPLLESIILKALAKDPADRQASMRHLRNELRELLAPVMLVDDAPASMPSMAVAVAVEGLSPATPLPEVPALEVPAPEVPSLALPESNPRMKAAAPGAAWLVDRAETYATFFTKAPIAGRSDGASAHAAALADALAQGAGPWLENLAATSDAERFVALCEQLGAAVRELLGRADAAALAPIVAAMRRILKEEPGGATPRARAAGRVLRSMRVPQLLVPIVDAVLSGAPEPTVEQIAVLRETQGAAAQALVEGRLEYESPTARARFAGIMREVGGGAVPVVRSALEGRLARGDRSSAVVEDLLRALPAVPDEATGKVVAQFLRAGTPETYAAALLALVRSWGDRSRPLLLSALDAPDVAVRIAGVSGLRMLRAIDGHVVRRLSPIVTGAARASEELRVAGALALGEAVGPARGDAVAVVLRAFQPGAATVPETATALGRGSPPPPPSGGLYAVALGRALIALGVPNAAALVQERAATSPEVVRRQLLALLAR